MIPTARTLCAALTLALPVGTAAAAPDAPALEPRLLKTVTHALRAEGLPATGADRLTRAEALHLLNTLSSMDDPTYLPEIGRVKRLLTRAAQR